MLCNAAYSRSFVTSVKAKTEFSRLLSISECIRECIGGRSSEQSLYTLQMAEGNNKSRGVCNTDDSEIVIFRTRVMW